MERSCKGVALDTNVLLTILDTKQNCVQEIRDVFGKKFEIVYPTQVKNELRVLGKENKQLEKKAKIAFEILNWFGVLEKKIVARNADEALEKLAAQEWAIVTNDRELAKKIQEKSGKVWRLSRGRLLIDV
ncbi:MAG: hypothetical protein J4215_06080 [Candidatus Diapherotrites archaeon]|uniref:VapC9 PIN-like domain-containing protein n=1 Tax=Candidatus Iainarchaeum sp. TaxID=3101447 RepID=A0A8T4L6D6_9ARCH|nr:hypothetical protein [Candidatus Diapherotrites archaeon]